MIDQHCPAGEDICRANDLRGPFLRSIKTFLLWRVLTIGTLHNRLLSSQSFSTVVIS
jgi:hypothetical protein